MLKNSKIYVAGSNGMVGSAIVRNLRNKGFENIVTKSSKELDLRSQKEVFTFFETEKPEYVFLVAAKVGGIYANNAYPAEFLYDNMMIQNNVIHAAHVHNVEKLLFLGSSCIYPKMASQPLKEDYLLTGALEPTNEAYAIAKIAGLKMCQYYKQQYGANFISAMPTNLYGINDNFNLQNSHVLPALLRKFIEAKHNNEQDVVVWGSGSPMREFLFVDDLAEACVFLMMNYNDGETINIGTGEDVTIKELAEKILELIPNSKSKIIYVDEAPDDAHVRKPDITLAKEKLNWEPKIKLEEGLIKTIDFLKSCDLVNFK